MKSSYELAMERMGGGDSSLTDDQKKEISAFDAKYKAIIAEKKIFLEKSISDALAQGKEEDAGMIRKQVSEEISGLEAKAEREKENIHEQK